MTFGGLELRIARFVGIQALFRGKRAFEVPRMSTMSSIHSIILYLCQGRTGWVMVVPCSAVVGDFDRSSDSAGNEQETCISAH